MGEQIGRRAVAQRLVRAAVVVELEAAIQRRKEIRSTGEVAGINELVLSAAPQALDENVVQGAAPPIHTDQDTALLQRRQKIGGGELGTLIGVPDLRLAETEGGLQRGQTKGRLHRIGQFPTEHKTTEPIHDGDQVQETATHGKAGNIGAPDLAGPLDQDAAQQVRADLVARRRTAQVWFRIKGFDSHDTHQPLDALAVHFQGDRHAATAKERTFQVQFVQPPEQTQVLRTLRPWPVVVGRARQTQQFALLLDVQARMFGIDP